LLGLKIGDDKQIKFWHDLWCGDILLKEDYPVLFHVACDRDATVAQFMVWSNRSFHWNPGFLRTVRDCELEFLICFFEEIFY
jgi:hypothetical protein